MGLRKYPKRNALFGVHWSKWPWPSLVVQSMWRHFVPKPMDADSQYRRSMFHRLSLVYVFVSWAGLTFVAYHCFKDSDKRGENGGIKSLIPYVYRRETLEAEGAKFKYMKIRNFTVVEEEEDVKQELIELKKKSLGIPVDDTTPAKLSSSEMIRLLSERRAKEKANIKE